MNLGLSGRLTQGTIRSPLTPLLLLAGLAMGLIALVVIPREEEPQISVPMVDITVRADGLKAPDAVELVTKPLEAIVKGIDGVEHVYSQTQDDRVMVTARFLVGTKAEDAIVRVHEKVRANYDRMPLGIPEPLIVGRGINDVAILTLTLSPKPEAAARWTDKDLYELADKLRGELINVENVGLSYISGGNPSRSASSPTRRSWRCTASPCSSWPPRSAAPTARSRPDRCAMPAACAPCRRGRRSRACRISASCC
jgi:multidrug efflux pump subunit AcrB